MANIAELTTKYSTHYCNSLFDSFGSVLLRAYHHEVFLEEYDEIGCCEIGTIISIVIVIVLWETVRKTVQPKM